MTREEQLKAYLRSACYGRENLASGSTLERALNLSGTDLRKLVHRLRCKGVPIASNRTGYYYAATAKEIYTTIRQLRQMVSGLERAIAGLESAMEQFGEAGP